MQRSTQGRRSGEQLTGTIKAPGPSGTDDRERKRRRKEPKDKRPTMLFNRTGDGATVVEEVRQVCPHSPVVTEQPPADGAAEDTEHTVGSCTLGLVHVLEGANIQTLTDDLHAWKPAIIAVVCHSSETANKLKEALEETEPPWKICKYEHIMVARRESVFDRSVDDRIAFFSIMG